MSHRIHDSVTGFPQIDSRASHFNLNDYHVILTSLEVSPDLGPQVLLCFPVHLCNVIAFLPEPLSNLVIVRTERREYNYGFTELVNKSNEFLQLRVTKMMYLALIIIYEASSYLSALRYVRYRQFS